MVIASHEQPVRGFEDLVSSLVTKAAPGQVVTLTVVRDGSEQTFEVELGARPTQAVAAQEQGDGAEGEISARAAIAIAEDAAVEAGLTGEIAEKVATPDEQDGAAVWVVELSAGDQQATVVINADNGEVVSVDIR